MKSRLIIFSINLILMILSCSIPTKVNEEPEWIMNLIEEFKSLPVGNPPQSIWQYTYKNRLVYYIPPQCCDQFSTLYDKDGNFICAPDGGMTGSGDGKCPDFFEERTNEKLIWKDERVRK